MADQLMMIDDRISFVLEAVNDIPAIMGDGPIKCWSSDKTMYVL